MLRLAARAATFLAVAGVLAAGAAAWRIAQPLPLPFSPYVFDVKSGATLKSVARELVAAGILPTEYALVVLARVKRMDRAIKAGNYEIGAGITLTQLLDKLTQGDVTQSGLTIVEGSTVAELMASIRVNPAVAKTVPEPPAAEIARRTGITEPSLEGWFFPDTYYFATGSSDLALLVRAHRLMRERLDRAWAKRATDLPLKDPYEMLILASVVEKETGRAADRPLIASVFVNRLRAGMRLQSDPTVIYGLDARFDGNLRKRDLEADTPYNTYTRDGLPPTPIALPGQAALDAVANPAQTPYLYFVARGDGSSEFSANLAEHNRAVAKFQLGRR